MKRWVDDGDDDDDLLASGKVLQSVIYAADFNNVVKIYSECRYTWLTLTASFKFSKGKNYPFCFSKL